MRIFVGGLPRTATKDDIVKLFRQFGATEENVVLPRDRRTRRRKGVAYIDIAETEKADAAIAVFAGFEVDGRALTVCRAEDRPLKKPRGRRAFAIATMLGAATLFGTPVRAEHSVTDVALTLNPIFGTHQSFNDKTTPPPVPVPLLEVRHRAGPFEFFVTGLPPIASARSTNSVQGRTSTRLTIFDGTARVWDPLRRFSIGIGQTLYNQSTHYLDSPEIAGVGERQFSRITGVHYEVGYRNAVRGGLLEAKLSVAPLMRGTQFTQYDVPTIATRVDPEQADQIDTSIRFVRRINSHGELIYGLRYLNYTARYAEPSGTLSDRNAGFFPTFGYRTRIGR
ncbi:MAG: hypothetical protein NVS2B17_14770 [Candidatus Velthaea sp.]